MSILLLIVLFLVATVIGYKVIGNVPSLLHTPLMSGMNALSGITVLGALVATAAAVTTQNKMIGSVAIIIAMINVVGGFAVTHRMLKMFHRKEDQ
ncbi:MAG TPA: NAD(P) transhydrogenase subunit alpha [Atribacter sp.]|jgi:NAD(P) transhydrogenase subunit alpha|uniref:proton-translocating NAD(P)(+) transhydrogenase n=1 Tax=Candidatus Atribacter allofermentans TaxID=1852833 RepID=A0A1V5SRA7_9BACT|nr:NAD(P) transhydrogenase subunit alpha [Atribacter sp.]MDD3714033.1 NAD(P) transhydrogenase subunit alpha [Atribacterota bacterium]OQA57015.1 MAG: NAD(P) transhydrogenase subunit alpha [Candidatus Atribacteria bacterium ADurb.Bin276]HHT10214.1 NAD(P) transhydrogenase subunit alpha [Candidatus Atribacteria bacterium]MDI9594239.1 NAD(P) transhydrogenase subunit alpha [Atribacterota bacterium]HQK83975.1 NAD(P) transhydrogenase subunit alpha [Atribacter sp.]